MRERTIGILIAIALLAIVGMASFAIQRGPSVEQIAVEDLPDCTTCVDDEPTPEQCAQAGGTVRYRRTNECFSEPDVHDACGFGVPCFTDGDGFYCRDVKDPYCHCEADSQCPENYYCAFSERSVDGKAVEPIVSTGQCLRVATDSTEPVRELRSTVKGL